MSSRQPFGQAAQCMLVVFAFLVASAVARPAFDFSPEDSDFRPINFATMDKEDNFTIQGVGASISEECSPAWNFVLNSTDEFNKAGSAGAAMIMALLPSLLAFGPLKIANIRTFLHLGTAATLVTAVFTFGLPVEKLSTLKEKNVKSAAEFMGGQYDNILKLVNRIDMMDDERDDFLPPDAEAEKAKKEAAAGSGRPAEEKSTDINPVAGQSRTAAGPGSEKSTTDSTPKPGRDDPSVRRSRVSRDLRYLQSLYHGHRENKTPLVQKFHSLATRNDRPSRLRIYLITAIFIVLQTALGFTVAYFIPQIDSIYFIWACPRRGYKIFVYWFGATLVLVSLAQVILESPFLHADEVLHLSTKQFSVRVVKCPRLAAVAPVEYNRKEGRHMHRQVSGVPGFAYLKAHGRFPDKDHKKPETWEELSRVEKMGGESTWTHEIGRRAYSAISALKALATFRDSRVDEAQRAKQERHARKASQGHVPEADLKSGATAQTAESHSGDPSMLPHRHPELKAPGLWKITVHILRFTWYRLSTPHPMVVILRPSEQFVVPRNPLITFFIGYLQLIWLGLVSILFGSTAGGTLVYTLAFVAAFVTTVAVARALGIYFCYWLEKQLDVQVLEYDSAEEQRALKMLICSAGAERDTAAESKQAAAAAAAGSAAGLETAARPPRAKYIWVESQTGFYRYSKGFRLTPVPCEGLFRKHEQRKREEAECEACQNHRKARMASVYGAVLPKPPHGTNGNRCPQLPQAPWECRHIGVVYDKHGRRVPAADDVDSHGELTRESIGGWGFEILCFLVALVFACAFGLFMGVGLGFAWGFAIEAPRYGILVGLICFGITAALCGFTVWEETHATEEYKILTRETKIKFKRKSREEKRNRKQPAGTPLPDEETKKIVQDAAS
ncbi:hypothetical protein DFH27DRAFT_553488 [Peziza echinospora]|nr:hypothetical protein DFH27DRAFT_553488 [Peziza echinospora]